MLALLETEIYLPTGKNRRNRAEQDVSITEGKILGMDVLYAVLRLPKGLPSRRTDKRFALLLNALTRAGVGKVCLRRDFLFRERVTDAGFSEPNEKNLWQAKAADIAEKSVHRRKSALIVSNSMPESARIACADLCADYRTVALLSDRCMAAFCREMCEKTGVSILEKPGITAVGKADTALVYDVSAETVLGAECTAIFMDTPTKAVVGMGGIVTACDFSYCGSDRFTVGDGYCKNALLAEAYRYGKCAANDIKLKNVERKSTGATR